mmetsp:Transcript_8731/g.25611  ORF Transcript_8731/g.25611 Transcript_8731/m.25611 type:complete len:256 (+) Transcript_8731:3449-4216(+)
MTPASEAAAGGRVASADLTSSSDEPAPDSMLVTFSTSTSTWPSLLATSAITFFPSSLCSKSFRIRANGASFFWASFSFSWRVEYSVRATFLASGAYCFAAVIFWLILPRAPLIASCAFRTAASVSLRAVETDSVICSASSRDTGPAAAATASSVSSAEVTASMASGSASSRALASRCSALAWACSAFARCLASSASCRFFSKSCFACFASCARLACTLRTRGVRLFMALTLFGDDFLASIMSAARTLCASIIELC